jgi:hypothetical protein
MKLTVPYKYLDLAPEPELLNFNFDTVTLEQWGSFRILKDNFPNFKELDSIEIYGVVPDVWRNPSIDAARYVRNIDLPVTAHMVKEIEKLEKLYNARAMVAVLDRLDPGAQIYRHCDVSPIFQKSHRVHLPLVTQPGALFYIDDVEYHMPRGQFFEFDNSRFHSVINNSDSYRVHLIVDLLPYNT